ncbi:MAG TPA: molybdenum cofactor guanylyltransferase [Candidatus Sulfotelmatobacter sp.]|nr:molybdenum cofactor guanylyltransferase [Candidatus Sulfotelmatobacter sp.]
MTLPAGDLTTFLLAGGKSTRMGTDKAFVEFDGETLLARMLKVARTVSKDVRIVGDRQKFAAHDRVVEDIFPNCGPLAGIHAALRSSFTDRNLILAVDVPFITTQFLDFLITHSRGSSADVTLVRAREGWQPLCAVYRRMFADAAEDALRKARYKIDLLFDAANLCVISESELQAAGFSPQLFRNLNTPKELEDARRFPGR